MNSANGQLYLDVCRQIANYIFGDTVVALGIIRSTSIKSQVFDGTVETKTYRNRCRKDKRKYDEGDGGELHFAKLMLVGNR